MPPASGVVPIPSTLTPSLSSVRSKVGTTEKHADRARQRRRTREDFVRGRRDVVAARGGIRAHRNDHRLAGLTQALHFAQDLLGGEHAATGTVDPQHHGLDAGVVARLAQQIAGALPADGARRLMAVENLARSDDDAHARIGLRLQRLLRAHRGQILAHRDRIERMRVGVLTDERLELLGKLAAALQTRDQAALQRELRGISVQRRERRGALRDVIIERIRRERASARDVGDVGMP